MKVGDFVEYKTKNGSGCGVVDSIDGDQAQVKMCKPVEGKEGVFQETKTMVTVPLANMKMSDGKLMRSPKEEGEMKAAIITELAAVNATLAAKLPAGK